MGGNTSSLQKNNDSPANSQDIERNIKRVFRERNNSNKLTEFETLGWNQNMSGGGMTSKNRYDAYHPETLINQLIADNERTKRSLNNMTDDERKQQIGGLDAINFNVNSQQLKKTEEDEYKEIVLSDDLIATLKKHVLQQTGGSNTQCPCDSNGLLSETSANTIDYAVLKGGAADDETSEEEGEEEGEGEDDEEEGEGEETNDDEEEEDADEETDAETDETDSDKKEKDKSKDKDKKKEPKKEATGSSSSVESISESGKSLNMMPFYSSDGEHFVISKRHNRF